MPKKKPGLTTGQHKKLGNSLKDMHNSIIKMQVDLANAYPRKGFLLKFERQSGKILTELSKLRYDILENAFIEEYPDEEWRGVYSGSASRLNESS